MVRRDVPTALLILVLVASPFAASALAQQESSPPGDGWHYTSPGPRKCVEVGNLYLHKGNLPGALSRFQEALKDSPDYPPAELGIARVYDKMGEKQKALQAYQRYLDDLPSAKDASDAKEARRAIARLAREQK